MEKRRCPCPRTTAYARQPAEAIVRGYEYAPGHYVIMEAEELEQLRPARDHVLIVEQFVPVGNVDPLFFAGRSLYLLPDGAAAQHPYGVAAGGPRGLGPGGMAMSRTRAA